MPTNLENSPIAPGLEKVSFHSNPKERKCQRMFELPHNCIDFTCQRSIARNPSSQASAIHELKELLDKQTGFGKAEEPEIKLPTSVESEKKQENSRKTSASLTMLNPLNVQITTNWKILQEMGIPDHLTCLLRNLLAGQKATVRTGHGTTDQEYTKSLYCQPAYLT